jgi:hypothetical protein
VLPVAAALVRDPVLPRVSLLAVEVLPVLGHVPAVLLHLQRGREVNSLSADGVTVRHQPLLELTAAALDGLLLPGHAGPALLLQGGRHVHQVVTVLLRGAAEELGLRGESKGR